MLKNIYDKLLCQFMALHCTDYWNLFSYFYLEKTRWFVDNVSLDYWVVSPKLLIAASICEMYSHWFFDVQIPNHAIGVVFEKKKRDKMMYYYYY
jgi:hypothetical protein